MCFYETVYKRSSWTIKFKPKFTDRTSVFGIVWSKCLSEPIVLREYLDILQARKAQKDIVKALKEYGVIRKSYDGEFKIILLRSEPDHIQTILIFDACSDTLLLKLSRIER